MFQAMGEETGKKPPVLIESVNVIINVYNIEHVDVAQAATSAEFLPGIVEGEEATVLLEDPLLEVSGAHPEWVQLEDSEVLPLGWIACYGGGLLPFGVQSIAEEVPGFGDKGMWKEIRVCLPPSFFVDNESDWYCPVASCREKLPKNKSIDIHIKKHLGLGSENPQTSNNANQTTLPCPLLYYCQERCCQYNVKSAEKSFKAYKNVKQHYIKVHAPRLFECEMCQKTFSTLKVAETHKLMCGEKYLCSTCDASYNSLEALQTHCRRKGHVYDHVKYKDKKNSVKQEMQMQYSKTVAAPHPVTTTVSAGGRKQKIGRKFPTLRPKVPNSEEVFNSIQALCRQAGVKVDYGCQTVCSAFLQKSDPVEAVVTSPTASFTQKKRKSTDTQTNIVKFRATCLDQRHNATNTNQDWKTVVTSDSQTQTAESDPLELVCAKSTDAAQFNDEFATIKISETAQNSEVDEAVSLSDLTCSENCEVSFETDTFDTSKNIPDETGEIVSESPTSLKDDMGPSLYEEFISFLEATDSATQTDPDMFDMSGGDCLGINVNLDNDFEHEQNVYVSVSSTASQTAVESISSKSLSAEDYEALLNAADDKRLADIRVFSHYIKAVEGIGSSNSSENTAEDGTEHEDDELLFDWENLVEEVYRDVEQQGTKNSQP